MQTVIRSVEEAELYFMNAANSSVLVVNAANEEKECSSLEEAMIHLGVEAGASEPSSEDNVDADSDGNVDDDAEITGSEEDEEVAPTPVEHNDVENTAEAEDASQHDNSTESSSSDLSRDHE